MLIPLGYLHDKGALQKGTWTDDYKVLLPLQLQYFTKKYLLYFWILMTKLINKN